MNAREREEVLSQVIQLTAACPIENCATPLCPLFEVRKLAAGERMEWIRALSNEDLEFLSAYHQICLQWMGRED